VIQFSGESVLSYVNGNWYIVGRLCSHLGVHWEFWLGFELVLLSDCRQYKFGL